MGGRTAMWGAESWPRYASEITHAALAALAGGAVGTGVCERIVTVLPLAEPWRLGESSAPPADE